MATTRKGQAQLDGAGTASINGALRSRRRADMVAIAAIDRVDANALTASLDATFGVRGTHDIPNELPDPPASWKSPFARLARESPTSPTTSLEEAIALARAFWNPLLRGEVAGARWDPGVSAWD